MAGFPLADVTAVIAVDATDSVAASATTTQGYDLRTHFLWDASRADCYFCLVAEAGTQAGASGAGSGSGDGSRDPLFLNCEAADRAQRDMFVNGFTKLLLENGGVRTGVRHGSEGAEGGAATQELVQAFKVSCARSAARVLCT